MSENKKKKKKKKEKKEWKSVATAASDSEAERLRNSRRNTNGQRSGNTSYRHSYGTGRATTSSCTIYHREAVAATLGT